MSNTTADSIGRVGEAAQALHHGQGALAQRVGDLAVAGGDRRLHGNLLLAQAPPEPAMMSWRCRSVSAAVRSQVRLSAKRPGAGAEPRRPAAGVAGQLEHPARQRLHVAVGHQVSGLAVAHRVAQAGAVRGDRRRAARGRLDHGDAPPFLGRREHVRPGPPEQVDLLGLAHEAVEASPRSPSPAPPSSAPARAR